MLILELADPLLPFTNFLHLGRHEPGFVNLFLKASAPLLCRVQFLRVDERRSEELTLLLLEPHVCTLTGDNPSSDPVHFLEHLFVLVGNLRHEFAIPLLDVIIGLLVR